jgi:2-amino-4-hydroxy-6-hydroxymethyldihydropteridine diphosphokinase
MIYPIGMWCFAMIIDGIQSGLYGTTIFFALRAYAFLLLRAGLMNSYDKPTPISSRPFGIAIGTNLGDRLANLQRGVSTLVERVQPTAIIAGALYETDPVDCAPGTQAFLNSVIEIEAACTPQELHAHLQAIEQAMGRPAIREQNSPRALDLDVLYAGDFVSDDPQLIVPHPRLHLRRFVLQPLADIRPDLTLPGHSFSIAQHLAALQDDPMEVRLVTKDWMKNG